MMKSREDIQNDFTTKVTLDYRFFFFPRGNHYDLPSPPRDHLVQTIHRQKNHAGASGGNGVAFFFSFLFSSVRKKYFLYVKI